MTKKPTVDATTETNAADDMTDSTEFAQERTKPRRKKVYERIRESQIPPELDELFLKDDYELRLVRWCVQGQEDYRYLNRREQEGYEFVTKDELPSWYLQGIRLTDTKNRHGLITIGDLCLMKVDKDLRNSRRRYYAQLTREQVDAVDINVLEKKGFKNLGSKSKVIMREPAFQE